MRCVCAAFCGHVFSCTLQRAMLGRIYQVYLICGVEFILYISSHICLPHVLVATVNLA